MEDEQLLDICLKVTGSFEGGTPRYDAVNGNSDREGMSAGILQWNVGQGTLQILLTDTAATMGWPTLNAFFKLDMEAMSHLPPQAAIAFVKRHFLIENDDNRFQQTALQAWRQFLSSPESVSAQRAYAEETVLAAAHRLAGRFVPEAADRTRVIAFFFDLITQQGSMKTVEPIEGPASSGPALFYAASQNIACTTKWRAVVGDDPLAQKLLYYAFERVQLGIPAYMWDSLSRRGTIATRVGIVHETPIDLTEVLD